MLRAIKTVMTRMQTAICITQEDLRADYQASTAAPAEAVATVEAGEIAAAGSLAMLSASQSMVVRPESTAPPDGIKSALKMFR